MCAGIGDVRYNRVFFVCVCYSRICVVTGSVHYTGYVCHYRWCSLYQVCVPLQMVFIIPGMCAITDGVHCTGYVCHYRWCSLHWVCVPLQMVFTTPSMCAITDGVHNTGYVCHYRWCSLHWEYVPYQMVITTVSMYAITDVCHYITGMCVITGGDVHAKCAILCCVHSAGYVCHYTWCSL